jgi:hypothetical protein
MGRGRDRDSEDRKGRGKMGWGISGWKGRDRAGW